MLQQQRAENTVTVSSHRPQPGQQPGQQQQVSSIKDWANDNSQTAGGEEEAALSSSDAHQRSRGRSRRELPPHAVSILKAWLVSPEHFHHPYPTAQDQAQLMAETGIDKKQLKNWFTNARRRIWKPLVKHKLQASESIGDLDDEHVLERADGEHASNHSMASRRSTTSSFLDLLATAVDGDSTNSFSVQQSPRAARRDSENYRSVPVSPNTSCSFCLRDRVDTQLVPCKHLFHGCCLRPWLEATVTTPCCPVCSVAISNCVLADTNHHQANHDSKLPAQVAAR